MPPDSPPAPMVTAEIPSASGTFASVEEAIQYLRDAGVTVDYTPPSNTKESP